ncbi:Sensor protein ZraS [Bremerella volcania]|uniref:histidine kinase n=1 Tax=Bremerella volcania TaxID=2527984 RepID=A0A518C3Z5_9BACT|nr:HAMP domain-containing sensor histidine kinase [Bremerella volcania]QDU73948.1 Sensor protein ZraS [Bremerella volcania]
MADSIESERDLRDEKLNSLKRLAYGASHEINNPLANIASRAQALLVGETDPDRRHELATIYAQAMRGHEMIADLMLFARPPQPQLSQCQLSVVAKDAVGQMLPVAQQQETELKLITTEHDTNLTADANLITLAACALIRNALEALKSGGKVEVTLATDDEVATIAVQDDGPGIPDDQAEIVFDPFHSGREAGRGLGFGLTKCWTIAQAHGGDTYVDTAYGPGARIVLEIPLSPKATSESE